MTRCGDPLDEYAGGVGGADRRGRSSGAVERGVGQADKDREAGHPSSCSWERSSGLDLRVRREGAPAADESDAKGGRPRRPDCRERPAEEGRVGRLNAWVERRRTWMPHSVVVEQFGCDGSLVSRELPANAAERPLHQTS